MQWQQLIIDIFERISQELELALDGLTADELKFQPCLGCNSIGWLTWHLTRAQDKHISSLLDEEQIWIKEKWYAKYNRPHDPNDTGWGHSLEDVAAFSAPDTSTLLGYHRAVLAQTKSYIRSMLTEDELNRELDNPTPAVKNVRTRLMRTINDNMQHLGQVLYVRGIIKGWGWLGR